ncbi:recombination protein NinB [Rhizobium sp. 21-4511-3d]
MTRALVVIQTQADRDRAARWAQGVPVGSRIEFKETKRSLPQNDRLWAMLTDISAHMKKLGRDHTPDQWKVIFMAAYGHEVKFLPTLDQKSFIPLGHSSSDLSVREMTDLIEFMLAWGAEAGVEFNDPKEQPNSGSDSQPDKDEDSPSSSQEPADPPPLAGSSPIAPQAWLLAVSKMLWAATNYGGDIEVLKAQKVAAMSSFEVPTAEGYAAKANGVYGYCRQVVLKEMSKADGLAMVAGVVGVDQHEIGGAA